MDESINPDITEITGETLKELLDYLSDEIFIFNQNRQIIYANKACEKNYGLTREDLIGKYSNDLLHEKYWTPSIYPEIHKSKKPISIIQTTNTGAELLTSAIPVLNRFRCLSLPGICRIIIRDLSEILFFLFTFLHGAFSSFWD